MAAAGVRRYGESLGDREHATPDVTWSGPHVSRPLENGRFTIVDRGVNGYGVAAEAGAGESDRPGAADVQRVEPHPQLAEEHRVRQAVGDRGERHAEVVTHHAPL